MARNRRPLFLCGVLFCFIWLTAACSPAVSTSIPTLDTNPVRTEVAATVLAQVTRDLASTPSVTPLPNPTDTTQPTSTSIPTASPSPEATAAQSSGTPKPGTVNLAQWVSQSVADGTVFKPGETFTMTWRLKNTGTSTWTTAFRLRYYSGETFGAPKEMAISQEVPPGGEIDINIAMKAPASPGSYRSDWVMANESLSNFKEPVYLKITVAAPATPTATPKP